MANRFVASTLSEEIKQIRNKIQACFRRTDEALRVRERILLSRIDEIEKEHVYKSEEIKRLVESLNTATQQFEEAITANVLTDVNQAVRSAINKKIEEITADTCSSIEFEWDDQFESRIEQVGRINLGIQSVKSPTLSPVAKQEVPDYKTKQLPTIYCGKKSSSKKAPGEFDRPRSIAVHGLTGNVYVTDRENNRVQVFTCEGNYIFMFGEQMNSPTGICTSHDTVFVTQINGHYLNVYHLNGEMIRSVGGEGNENIQFKNPQGIAVSDWSNNLYVCDRGNRRVQILTEEFEFLSVLGLGYLKRPYDVKVTQDKVFVLDLNNPCLFVFDSSHSLTNRLITRGSGKQITWPLSFNIDVHCNIIMSDYDEHCVYVFNQKGEQIHRFGQKGQGIGDFCCPYGVALDNSGRIVVVCEKDTNCLQFF